MFFCGRMHSTVFALQGQSELQYGLVTSSLLKSSLNQSLVLDQKMSYIWPIGNYILLSRGYS
jgi:hypothetical protein